MTSASPTSYWHMSEESEVETAAAVETSLAGLLLRVDDWDKGCTAPWVCEQSSIDEFPDANCPASFSVASSPLSDGPATAVDSLTPFPAPPPHQILIAI